MENHPFVPIFGLALRSINSNLVWPIDGQYPNYGFKNWYGQRTRNETSYQFYGPTEVKPMMS